MAFLESLNYQQSSRTSWHTEILLVFYSGERIQHQSLLPPRLGVCSQTLGPCTKRRESSYKFPLTSTCVPRHAHAHMAQNKQTNKYKLMWLKRSKTKTANLRSKEENFLLGSWTVRWSQVCVSSKSCQEGEQLQVVFSKEHFRLYAKCLGRVPINWQLKEKIKPVWNNQCLYMLVTLSYFLVHN